MVIDASPSMGLRERKKMLTRHAILDAAQSLFEKHGYDHVTVAQIADAADISVKTLFTYFASKEDLAFGDEGRLREELSAAVRTREAGTSPLSAALRTMERWVVQESQDNEPAAGLDGFRRGYGESVALQNRLRRMWQDYEDAITDAIGVSGSGRVNPAAARLQAMQIVLVLRYLTTPEVGDAVARASNPIQSVRKHLRQAAASASAAFEVT